MDISSAYSKISLLEENIKKVIRGKDDAIRLSVATLLAKGHLLIEDVPGVGKTTLAHSLAKSIEATFQRIQFTSDLMPSDVIGVTIFDQNTGDFEFRHGPIFANVVLADEINRATPKTQSALLEAMNEGQVSVDNLTYILPSPFFLIATQNPVDYAGTFSLPESQLDRFLMRIRIGYPDSATESEIINSKRSTLLPESLSPVLCSTELTEIQSIVETVRVEEDLSKYILDIVSATRDRKSIALGVSPRGAMSFFKAAQALAITLGRDYCTPDDIKSVAVPSLAHRIVPYDYTEADGRADGTGEGRACEALIEEILEETSVPV
jgi:MoxR-like ATPase